jgi:hypothetical protein
MKTEIAPFENNRQILPVFIAPWLLENLPFFSSSHPWNFIYFLAGNSKFNESILVSLD